MKKIITGRHNGLLRLLRQPLCSFLAMTSLIVIHALPLAAEEAPIFSKEDFIATAADKKILKIGMVDCIAMALKNNSEILVKRISPFIEDASVKIQKAVFEPDFSVDFSYEDNTEIGSNPLFAPAKSSARTGKMDFGYEQKLVTGTELELDFYNTRLQSNSRVQTPNPYFDSLAKVTVTQPLLKGFGIIVNKADFLIAKNNKLISEQDFAEEVIKILTDVKKNYYDYQYAGEQYRAVESALERSEGLHRINKDKYAKGLASDVDLLQSEAEVARAHQALAAAENYMKSAEDNLKLITNLIDDTELWNSDIALLDRIGYEKEEPDIVASINKAFKCRPDYEAARICLKNKDISVIFYKNGLLPTLDIFGAYGLNGLGGKLKKDLDRIANGDFRDWSAGLSVDIPLGNDDAKGGYDKAALEKTQAIIQFKRLEQNIILEVRDAVRNVDIKYRMLEASMVTKDAEDRNYKAQELRFQAGLVSTHDMVDYQNQLTRAEVNYIKSVVDYNVTLIELARAKGTMLLEDNITLE